MTLDNSHQKHFLDPSYDYMLGAIIENAPDGLIVIDENETIILANEAANKIFGYSSDELAGSNVKNLMPKKAAAKHSDYLKKYLSTGKGTVLNIGPREVIAKRKDGSTFPMGIALGVTKMADGPKLFIANCFDISKRINIREKVETQAAIIRQIKDPIAVTNEKEHITEVNDALLTMLGLEAADVLGKSIQDLCEVTLPEGETPKNLRETTISEGYWNGIIQLTPPGKNKLVINCTLSPYTNGIGEISGFIAVLRDITALQKSKESTHLIERVEALGRIAGGVAHNINNILFPMYLHLDQLKHDLKDETNSKDMEVTMDSFRIACDRIKDIVGQILTLSIDVKMEKIDASQAIKEALEVEKLTVPSSIALNTNIPKDPIYILASNYCIDQILQSLISNAVDAIDHKNGEIKILVTANSPEKDKKNGKTRHLSNGFLLIAIEDNGRGIEEGSLETIFEPFYTTKAVNKGTGLGLSQVTRIIDLLGGNINIESTLGEGTKLTLKLPLALQ